MAKRKTVQEKTLDKLYALKNMAEQNLAPLVERMINDFDSLKGKEKIMFIRFLEGITLHKDRLREDLGLNPKQIAGGAQHPMIAIFAGMDPLQFKHLNEEQKEEFLLQMAGGKKPTVIDVPAVVDGKEKPVDAE